MAYILKPPTVEEGPAGGGILFWRYRLNRANSLLMTGGVVTSIRTPDVASAAAADYFYQGGHEYNLSNTEYTQLVAAGYGANITTVP